MDGWTYDRWIDRQTHTQMDPGLGWLCLFSNGQRDPVFISTFVDIVSVRTSLPSNKSLPPSSISRIEVVDPPLPVPGGDDWKVTALLSLVYQWKKTLPGRPVCLSVRQRFSLFGRPMANESQVQPHFRGRWCDFCPIVVNDFKSFGLMFPRTLVTWAPVFFVVVPCVTALIIGWGNIGRDVATASWENSRVKRGGRRAQTLIAAAISHMY